MLTCRWVQMCLIVVEIDVIYGWRIFIQLYKEMLSWEYLFCQLPRGTLNEQLSSVLSGDSDIPECILLISTSEWQGQVIVKHLLLVFYLKYVGLLLGISISLQIQIFFFFLKKRIWLNLLDWLWTQGLTQTMVFMPIEDFMNSLWEGWFN